MERSGCHNYTNVLENGGFKAGKGSKAVFYHSDEDMQLLVHGDDLLALSSGSEPREDVEAKVRFEDRGMYWPGEPRCNGNESSRPYLTIQQRRQKR